MAVPPFAQVQASINGGANQSGGLTAAFGQSVALSAPNTTGWTAAIWELYEFPPGFSTPAGWSLASSGVIYFQPSNPTTAPPTFNWPASGTNNWGKISIRLRINNNPLQRNANGSPNANFVQQYTDEATVIKVLSPNLGMPGVAFNETTQFDTLRAAVGDLMVCLRKLDVTFGGGGTVTVTGSGILHATAGVLDTPAYHGTAGQLLFTNSGATDTTWASSSQDVTYSTSTPGQATVVGIRGNALAAPSGTNTTIVWNGSVLSWGSTPLGVSGSGVVHVTGGTTDASASKGTAGQFLLTNAGASDTAWTTLGGDVAASVSSVGQLTVVGIQTKAVPVPTGTNTVLTWSGSVFSWVASALGVTGSGVLHATSGTIDSAASKGTAGQSLFTNSGATDTAWTTFTQDVTASTSTPGQMTVVGLQTKALPAPSGTNTTLQWSGSALAWVAVSSGVTWANDLSGNGTTTNTNQYVSSLSFSSAGAGGTIAVNGMSTTLQWSGTGTNAGLSQASTSGATGADMSFTSQASTNTNGTSGNINVKLPAGTGTGTAGLFRVLVAGATQLNAGNISGTNAGYVWLGPQTPGSINFTLYSDGAQTNVNAVSTALILGTNGGNSVQINDTSGAAIMCIGSRFTGIEAATAHLSFSKTLSAPTINVNAQTTDAGTNTLTIQGQNALPGASIGLQGGHLHLAPGTGATTNGTPGNLRVRLGAPTGTGTEALVDIQRNAVPIARFQFAGGSSNNTTLWLGNKAAYTGSNYAITSDTSGTILNGSTLNFLYINNSIPGNVLQTVNGVQFFATDAFTPQFGSGSQVIGITNATTAPTTNPAGGIVLWGYPTAAANGGMLMTRGLGGWTEALSAPGGGTINTQQAFKARIVRFFRSTTNAVQTLYTYNLGAGSGGSDHLKIRLVGHDVTTAGAHTFDSELNIAWWNNSGTAVVAQTGGVNIANAGTTGTAAVTAGTPSGTSIPITVNSGTANTIDFTLVIDAYVS
jgi:hypothetical protein